MDAENQIDKLKEILNGADSQEIKRALEMLVRKMDSIELNLEKKMDRKFEEQNKFIKSLFETPQSPDHFPSEDPWFYS